MTAVLAKERYHSWDGDIELVQRRLGHLEIRQSKLSFVAFRQLFIYYLIECMLVQLKQRP